MKIETPDGPNENRRSIAYSVPRETGGPIKPIYLVRPGTGDIMGLVMPINLGKHKGKTNPILIDLKTIYNVDKEGFINDAKEDFKK